MSIVTPAYNAAEHIEKVASRLPRHVWPHIVSWWMIDDGATDNTGAIIDNLAMRNEKIRPLHFTANRGYGQAVREGLRGCLREECDFAACVHADGQYPPESVPEFVSVMQARRLDICQGSRIASGTALSGGMPLYKYIAGKVLTFFENIVFGLSMSDYHSGFLFYSRRALSRIPFDKLSESFDFDLEVIAYARAAGMNIGEAPISTRYAGERSYLNPITYGLRVLRVLSRYTRGVYRRMG